MAPKRGCIDELSFAFHDASHYLSTCAVQHARPRGYVLAALLGRFLPKLGPCITALFFA
jgi:hypothetical protein